MRQLLNQQPGGLPLFGRPQLPFLSVVFSPPANGGRATLWCQGKGHPRTGYEDPERDKGIALLFFDLGANGSGWSAPRPGRIAPGKETPYPLYRRQSGRRKISSSVSFDRRTVEPVASLDTD